MFWQWYDPRNGLILKFRLENMLSQKSQTYLHNSGFFVSFGFLQIHICLYAKRIYRNVCTLTSYKAELNKEFSFTSKGIHTTGHKGRRGWVLPAKHCPVALTLSSPGAWEGKLWPLATLGNFPQPLVHQYWHLGKTRAEKKKGLYSKQKMLFCSWNVLIFSEARFTSKITTIILSKIYFTLVF